MTVLSDRDILEYMDSGDLKIHDFIEKNLTPNGYDMTISEIKVEGSEIQTQGTVFIPPKTFFLVGTKEFLEFGEQISGTIWQRTTWARRGVQSTFGKIDAGFHGTLTVSAFNASSKTLEIEIGDRFCQIVVHKLSSPALSTYEKRSGNYQGQKNITTG